MTADILEYGRSGGLSGAARLLPGCHRHCFHRIKRVVDVAERVEMLFNQFLAAVIKTSFVKNHHTRGLGDVVTVTEAAIKRTGYSHG